MKSAFATRWALIAAASYLLLFLGMAERGLVSVDEPRYAEIAREMAISGDWVTPRLGGEPWFEKPALLYWMGAAAYSLGLENDRGTRLPVALITLLFLIYFHWQLAHCFGLRAADYATLILATSAGWVAFGQVGVFDMPLAASLGAALLVLLPWVQKSDEQTRKSLPIFGALLGLATLAKGLVAPGLAALAILPLAYTRGINAVSKDLFHPRATGPFLLVAGPWYALCAWRNGMPFVEEFFWRHHVERLFSESIQHVQPFWFFGPVLLAGLLPWTPVLALLMNREAGRGPQTRFLLGWALTTFLFFSLSTNKLPGYILPALPPLAALMGIRLAQARHGGRVLVAVAPLLVLAPLAGAVLPVALSQGLSRAWPPAEAALWPWAMAAAAVAGATLWMTLAGRLPWAMALLGLSAISGFVYLKHSTFPAIDREAGARTLWREIEPRAAETCVGDVRRHVRYGLDYYSVRSLPDCSVVRRPYRVESDPPRVVRAGFVRTGTVQASPVQADRKRRP